MSITFRKADDMYIGLSADDKTTIQNDGNIIYYVDTQAAEIYDNGAWNTYTLPVGGGGGGGSTLVAESALSGASVTVSGLDLNGDGGIYDMEIYATASAFGNLNITFNGQTTNYKFAQVGGTSNTVQSAITAGVANNFKISGIIEMAGGKPLITFQIASLSTSGLSASAYSGILDSVQANLTSITIATAFTGGTIKIFKRV